MKKISKKMFVFLMLFCTVLSLGSAKKAEAAIKTEKMYYTLEGDNLYSWANYDETKNEGDFRLREVQKGWVFQGIDGEIKLKSTSSNTSVMNVAVARVEKGVNDDGSKWVSSTLKFKIKRPGVAKFTAQIKDYYTGKVNTVKYEIHVAKYTNPIKSLKIGSKDYASKLANSPIYNIKKKLSGKLSVKANKNWSVKAMRIQGSTNMGIYTIVKKVKAKTDITVKKDQSLEIVLYNAKEDQYASVIVGGNAFYAVVYG